MRGHDYHFDVAAHMARKVADSQRLTAEKVRKMRQANQGFDWHIDEIHSLRAVLRDIASDDKNPAPTRALAEAALEEA